MNDILQQRARPEGRIKGEKVNRTMTLAVDLGCKITSGALVAGTVLPTEAEIQQTYSVSRTVVWIVAPKLSVSVRVWLRKA